jgi:hypothetical protein
MIEGVRIINKDVLTGLLDLEDASLLIIRTPSIIVPPT